MKLLFRGAGRPSNFSTGVWSQFIQTINLVSCGVPISSDVTVGVWNEWVTCKYAPPTKHWFGWCERFDVNVYDLLRLVASFRSPDSVSTNPRFRSIEDEARLSVLHTIAGDCKVSPDDLRDIISNSEFYHALTFQEPVAVTTSDLRKHRASIAALRTTRWCHLLRIKNISASTEYPAALCLAPVEHVTPETWKDCLLGLVAPPVEVAGTYAMSLGFSYEEMWAVYSLFDSNSVRPGGLPLMIPIDKQTQQNLSYRYKASWPKSVTDKIFTPEFLSKVRYQSSVKRVETRKAHALEKIARLEEVMLKAACENRGGDLARLRADLAMYDMYGLVDKPRAAAELKARHDADLAAIKLNKAQLAEVLTAPEPIRVTPEGLVFPKSELSPPPPPPPTSLPPPPPPPPIQQLKAPPLTGAAPAPPTTPVAEYEPTSPEAVRIRLHRLQEAERAARWSDLFYADTESVLSPEEQKRFPPPPPRPVPATPFVPKKFYDTLKM